MDTTFPVRFRVVVGGQEVGEREGYGSAQHLRDQYLLDKSFTKEYGDTWDIINQRSD